MYVLVDLSNKKEIPVPNDCPLILNGKSEVQNVNMSVCRKHAEITLNPDNTLNYKNLLTDAIYLKVKGKPPEKAIMFNEAVKLEHGDFISLLPDIYWFRVENRTVKSQWLPLSRYSSLIITEDDLNNPPKIPPPDTIAPRDIAYDIKNGCSSSASLLNKRDSATPEDILPSQINVHFDSPHSDRDSVTPDNLLLDDFTSEASSSGVKSKTVIRKSSPISDKYSPPPKKAFTNDDYRILNKSPSLLSSDSFKDSSEDKKALLSALLEMEDSQPSTPDAENYFIPKNNANQQNSALQEATDHKTLNSDIPLSINRIKTEKTECNVAHDILPSGSISGSVKKEEINPAETNNEESKPDVKPSCSSASELPNKTENQTETDNKGPTNPPSNRPICQYESNCYRKNLIHKRTFSHPGDVDFVESGNRPLCSYGSFCYRRSQSHKVNFQHPPNTSNSHQTLTPNFDNRQQMIQMVLRPLQLAAASAIAVFPSDESDVDFSGSEDEEWQTNQDIEE